CFEQRLVQMPAARHYIRQRRATHEARKHSMASGYLLCRRAEEHHGVGASQASLRTKSEFALARAKLRFHRSQRKAEMLDLAGHNFQRRIVAVATRPGETLITLCKQAPLRRFRRPRRIGRREARILNLEQ